jgi:hypothetical protein
MVAGDVIKRYANFGVEVTAGTPVVGTRKIPSTIKLSPVINYYSPDLQRGDYVTNYVLAPQGKLYNVSIETDLYLADVPMLVQGVMGGISPATVDTTGRVWGFPDTLTSAKKTFTLEWFDGNQGWKISYLCLTSLKISGEQDKPVKVTLTGFGQAMATVTPAVLSQGINTPQMTWQRIFSLDTVGVTPGTTPLSNYLTKFDFSIENGAKYIYAGNNTQLFSHVSYGKFKASCSLTCLMQAAAFQNANFEAGTPSVAEIWLRGPIITSSYQGLKLELPGIWSGWSPDAYEGANSVELMYMPLYDSTLTYGVKVEGTNLINAY